MSQSFCDGVGRYPKVLIMDGTGIQINKHSSCSPCADVGIPFRYLLETFKVSTTDNSPVSDQKVVALEDRTFLKAGKAQERLELFCNGRVMCPKYTK